MVTWTGWNGYVNQTNKTMNLSRDTWVTVYPEVRNFIKQKIRLRRNAACDRGS